ncbi:MAG: GNAT family N-acetyltransferase [bacterium]
MLSDLFRASNKFWHALYYDELVDSKEYQISHLKNADRLYFNCAHALNTIDGAILDDIENYFKKQKINPAIYLDPESPQDLEKILIMRGYAEVKEEQENWYTFDCTQKQVLQELSEKIKIFQAQKPELECLLFYPMTNSRALKQFLKLDAEVNGINSQVLEKFKENLMNPRYHDLKFVCALALDNNIPATIGLIGLNQDMVFFAEGATSPDFRRQGIYTWLRQICMLFAAQQGCSKIAVNCDRDAYSNNTFKRLGFQRLCERKFFIKNKNI